MSNLKVDCKDRVLQLILADPETGNLLSDDILEDMINAISSSRDEADILVLRAEGTQFSIGRPKNAPPPEGNDVIPLQRAVPDNVRKALNNVRQLNHDLRHWPGVVVAAVQGEAHGAAAGFLVHCDVVIAEEGLQLSFPEMNYNLPPALVNSYISKWVNPGGAHYLVFTGCNIPVHVAQAWGIVHEIVPRGALESRVDELVKFLAARKPNALRMCKETLLEYRLRPDDEAAIRGLQRVLGWLSGAV